MGKPDGVNERDAVPSSSLTATDIDTVGGNVGDMATSSDDDTVHES